MWKKMWCRVAKGEGVVKDAWILRDVFYGWPLRSDYISKGKNVSMEWRSNLSLFKKQIVTGNI